MAFRGENKGPGQGSGVNCLDGYMKLKKTLIGAGIILLLLIAAAVVAPGFIDWGQYRGQITRIAENFIGREISINGDISFQLIPSPHLTAADVHVANVKGGMAEEFLSLEVLDLRVALLPLIAGQIQVESVILQGPVINLERYEDGSVNWLLGSSSTEQTNEQAPGSSGGNVLSLNSVEVQGGHLSFEDQTSGVVLEFEAINLAFSADSQRGPFQSSGSFSYADEALLFEFSLGRVREDRRAVIRLWFELAGQTPGIELNGTTMLLGETPDISARIRGNGSSASEFVLAAMNIAGGALTIPVNLEKTFEIDGNLNISPTLASLNPMTLTLGETTGQGVLELALGGEDSFIFSLAINSMVLEDWIIVSEPDDAGSDHNNGASTLPASFEIPDHLTGSFDLSIEALTYRQAVARQISLTGTVHDGKIDIDRFGALLPGGSSLSFSGQMENGEAGVELTGSLNLAANNLRQLLGWFGVDPAALPQFQLATFSYQGSVRVRSDWVEFFDAKGQLDISDFEGGISIGLGDRPAFAIDLKLSRLNLDSYLPPAPEGDPSYQQVKGDLLEALRPLAGFDANITLDIRNIIYGGWRAARFQTEAVLMGDRLSIQGLRLSDLEGLELAMSGTVANFESDPQIDLTIDVRSENLAGMVRRLDLASRVDPQALRSLSITGQVAGTFERVTLDLEGELGRAEVLVTGTVRDPGPRPSFLDISFSLNHPDHLDLIRRFALDWPLEGRGAPVHISGTLTGSLAALETNLDFSLFGGSGETTASMTNLDSEASVEGIFSFTHPDILSLVKGLGFEWAPSSRQLGSLKIEASLSGSAADFSLTNIRLDVGTVEAQGTISIASAPELRTIRGGITLGDIRLDRFMKPVTAGAQTASEGRGARWSTAALNLEWMAGLDLDLMLSAAAISYLEYQFEDLSTRLTIRDSILNFDEFKARLLGGGMSATFSLDGRGVPAVSGTIHLQDVSLERALQASAAIAPATGVLNLQGQYEGAGSSQLEIISNLNGSAQISGRDGVIRGFDVSAITTRLGRLNRLPDFSNLLDISLGGGETAYRFLRTAVLIEDGIMRADSLEADMDGARLSGHGIIDLPAWSIGASGRLKFEGEGNETVEPGEAAPENDLTGWLKDPEAPSVGVTIIGPLNAPRIEYDKQQLISYVGARFATSLIAGIFGLGGDDLAPDDTVSEEETPADLAGGIFGLIFSLIPKEEEDGG